MKDEADDGGRKRAIDIVAHFSALIHGWQTHDFREAAEAREALGRLGVTVKLPGSPRRGQSQRTEDAGND